MSSLLIQPIDTPWTPSNPAVLQVTADSATVKSPFAASNLLVASGALNATAEFAPAAPE
jgi:hypothetical protein